jgi:hypothetical protein
MAEKKEAKGESKSGKEEQVGFHKGSLSTLSKERQELVRILDIVEQLMQMHLAALKELGVDLESEAEKLLGKEGAAAVTPGKGSVRPKPKPPIEDVI